jgi:hypothetical protein
MKEPWLEYITKFADMGPLRMRSLNLERHLKMLVSEKKTYWPYSSKHQERCLARRFQVVQRIDDVKTIKKYGLWNEFDVKKKL